MEIYIVEMNYLVTTHEVVMKGSVHGSEKTLKSMAARSNTQTALPRSFSRIPDKKIQERGSRTPN